MPRACDAASLVSIGSYILPPFASLIMSFTNRPETDRMLEHVRPSPSSPFICFPHSDEARGHPDFRIPVRELSSRRSPLVLTLCSYVCSAVRHRCGFFNLPNPIQESQGHVSCPLQRVISYGTVSLEGFGLSDKSSLKQLTNRDP